MAKRNSKGRFVKRAGRRARRAGGAVIRRVKSKPSVAVIGGLVTGPALAVFGWGAAPGEIWKRTDNKVQELWSRITVLYVGHKMGANGGIEAWKVENGGYIGSIAAALGFGIHKLANMTGANKVLARMKFPFRI